MERAYIGRYRVVGKLGKGGMGTVIRAMDEGLMREVAIKLPNDSDPEDIQRLRQECDVLMQLQHHHIVQVYGSGSEPDLPFYIVMELVNGVTVEQMLRQQHRPLEPHQALKIALAVAEALAYAHRPPLRVIHRDIKPSNVLIRDSDGAIKVTDFGVAAVLAERSGRTAIGTLFYMAPEQATGQGVDERSDLYSLGAMLYEMLTGQRPPQLATAPATPPSNWLGTLPQDMRARIDWLVLGLLRGDRNQRQPQRAADVVEELRALLENRPSRPLSSPPIDPALASAPAQQPSASLSGPNPYAPYAPTERAAASPISGLRSTPVASTPLSGQFAPPHERAHRGISRWLIMISMVALVALGSGVAWFAGFHAAAGASPSSSPSSLSVLSPSPTQTATTETLTVPFTSATGVQTANTYSGLVTITVTGTGQASGIAQSDAFYIFTSYIDGQPITPTHPSDCSFVLRINGMPTDDFVNPIPPYQASHQYTFTMHAPGGTLNFAVGDGYTADNTGAYTITLTQQT